MEFYKNYILYSIIRTNHTTSEGTPIFKFTAWNKKGQMVNAGTIYADCIEDVKNILI